jgi:hypothetical protein
VSEPNPYDPSDPFEPLRPRRRPWRTIVGLIAIAAMVLTAVASYVGVQRGITQPGDDERRDDGNDVADDRLEAFIEDGWDERVVELVAFVESERGLEFERSVDVDFLTPEEFSDEIRGREDELTQEDREEMENLVPMLRAVGLVSGDIDLIDTQLDLLDTVVGAFYDVEDARIVVPAEELPDELPVELRVGLVHELVHALQDQHFGLDRDFDEETVEEGQDPAAASAGFSALVEGDAVRIERAYALSLSGSELDEYVATEGEQVAQLEDGLDEVPAVLFAFVLAPYMLGGPMVDIIAHDGGNAAVNRAFEEPPWTDKHVIDPTTYLAGETVTELPPPSPPAGASDPIDDGQLGALDVYLMLAERIDPMVALDAADAWGNAQYVTYEDADRTCIRAVATGATPRGDQKLLAAFEEWEAASPPATDASVDTTDAGDVLLASCDPGPDADVSHERATDVLTIPAIRSTITADAMQFAAMPIDEASELGDCFVRQLGVDELVGESEELPQDALGEALAACGF